MANIFQTLGVFSITRLRSRDITFLPGAISSPPYPSLPSVVARGPVITGPVSTGLVTGETWGVAVPVPAVPEVVWVIVGTEYHFKLDGPVSTPTNTFMIAFTDVADASNVKGPIISVIGQDTTAFVPGVAGANFDKIVTTLSRPLRSSWIPLDPEDTSDGWNWGVTFVAGTTGPGVDDIEIDMRGVLLVGYPVNFWNTGQLWEHQGQRGS